MPVLIVVVSVTVGVGLLVRELYRIPAAEQGPLESRQAAASVSPARQPGPATVELTADAAAHPDGDEVRRLLQAHFDAINSRNYDLWTTTVVSERIEAQPRREWLSSYRSTRDGSVVVRRIEAAALGRLNVLVGFVSTQDVADAPPDLPEPCIRWQLTLPVSRAEGPLKLATVPAGTTPERSAC